MTKHKSRRKLSSTTPPDTKIQNHIVACVATISLQHAFTDRSGRESSEGNLETTFTLQTPETSRFSAGAIADWNYPSVKGQKKDNESSRLDTRTTSKRSLSETNKPDDNYSAINTEITNLKNLPVETYLRPISKVSRYSNFRFRFFMVTVLNKSFFFL